MIHPAIAMTQPPVPSEEFFLRLNTKELQDLLSLVAKRSIQHRDFSLLMLFVSHTEWRSGKCRLTTAKAAELMNVGHSQVNTSVRRLKEFGLLTRTADARTGETYYLVNPYLVSSGARQKRGLAIKKFSETLVNETPIQGEDVEPFT